MFKHILVPTDGSVLSKEAARHAVIFAKETGARVTAFYARQGNSEEKTEEILGFVRNLCEEEGVYCRKLSWPSDFPYKVIVGAAEALGCDLIIMASRSRKGLDGFLLGSETQNVLTHSTVPVLVLRSLYSV